VRVRNDDDTRKSHRSPTRPPTARIIIYRRTNLLLLPSLRRINNKRTYFASCRIGKIVRGGRNKTYYGSYTHLPEEDLGDEIRRVLMDSIRCRGRRWSRQPATATIVAAHRWAIRHRRRRRRRR